MHRDRARRSDSGELRERRDWLTGYSSQRPVGPREHLVREPEGGSPGRPAPDNDRQELGRAESVRSVRLESFSGALGAR